MVRSLERDALLLDRVERLMTIPAVGPITALTWAFGWFDPVTEPAELASSPSFFQLATHLAGVNDVGVRSCP